MPEPIHKLQPNRTIHLRGFDDRGAAAALYAATETGFKVSGVFRDPADFAVVVLHDADNFFEHPRLKYLPEFSFEGVVLQFDVSYSGLQPLDSRKFPTIDWPYLSVIREDGTSALISLFDHATMAGSGFEAARASVAVSGEEPDSRIILWYNNLAYEWNFSGGEAAAEFLADSINETGWEAAGAANALLAEELDGNLTLTHARYGRVNVAGSQVTWQSGEKFQGVRAGDRFRVDDEETTVAAVADAEHATVFGDLGTRTNAAYAAPRGGEDGNLATLIVQAQEASGGGTIPFTGGTSAAWRVRLDFSALGIGRIRQCWLTFAPRLARGEAYRDTEFEAVFSNWAVTGDRTLRVAGPGSVRIEETDSWCSYIGTSWSTESGFYSRGFAARATDTGDSATIRYHCQHTHDLWLGTSLYVDRGQWGVSLDGDAETELDCFLDNEPQVNTRRRVRAAVAAGEHTLLLTHRGGGPCYLDFVEAVVAGDVPDAPETNAALSAAIDYDTDHTYKLPPARLLWIFDKLGLDGPMNEYIGVFWWNQRKRVDAEIPRCQIVFGGGFKAAQQDAGPPVKNYAADQIFLTIGDTTVGKTVLSLDGNSSIAEQLAATVNNIFVGVWARAAGNVLLLESRSPAANYRFAVSATVERDATRPFLDPEFASSGTALLDGNLLDGELGVWAIDTDASPALNRAVRDWHTDLFAECAARGREIACAYSMELVEPPAAFASRYPDGVAVETATGFGVLSSTHCSFVAPMLAYQKRVYKETADLLAAAGLPVVLQFGEFVWWFFRNAGDVGDPNVGMAYYDAETEAAAAAALGRPLHRFKTPDDDPLAHLADADFLRARLVAYCAALRAHVRVHHPSAVCEILLPLDVTYPEVYGRFSLGGRLNHYVNIPEEFRSPATAPFDRIKMEGLDFGSGSRDLDKATRCMRFPFAEMEWPLAKCRYLIAVFNGGCPWERELLQTSAERIPGVTYWAFDHVCLLGWPLSSELGGSAGLR